MSEKSRQISYTNILELLDSEPGKIHKITVANKTLSRRLLLIIKKAKEKGVHVQRIDKRIFEKRYKNYRDIYIEISDISYRSEENFIKENNNFRTVFLFDGVEDPRNLGAIVRSLYFFGIDAVVVPKKRSAPLKETAIRASSGALFKFQPYRISSIVKAIDILKEKGFKIYGADVSANKNLLEEKFEGRTAIVFGQEGKGISSDVKRKIGLFIKIKSKNDFESLNLSVSSSIFAFYLTNIQHFSSK